MVTLTNKSSAPLEGSFAAIRESKFEENSEFEDESEKSAKKSGSDFDDSDENNSKSNSPD